MDGGKVVVKNLLGGRFACWNFSGETRWGYGWCSSDVDVWEGVMNWLLWVVLGLG